MTLDEELCKNSGFNPPPSLAGSLTQLDAAPGNRAGSDTFVGLVGAGILPPPVLDQVVIIPKGETALVPGNLPVVPLVKAHSPVRLGALVPLLRAYHNKVDALYLEAGFRNGFRIPYKGPHFCTFTKNLKSVKGLEKVVWEKLVKELQEGWVAGPFDKPPLPTLHISPLGIIPKKAHGEYNYLIQEDLQSMMAFWRICCQFTMPPLKVQ